MIKAVIFDMYETLVTLMDGKTYFGEEIADDLGIDRNDFLPMWRSTETDRSIGKLSLENVLTDIMKHFGCFSSEKLNRVIQKRKERKAEVFEHLHAEIIPMLDELKKRSIRIGLISNCYSEEAEAIKESVLFSYFDAVCLSYDEGVQKPDREIFERCLERLALKPAECLYVGDGGSDELEAARGIGMETAQAVWYLKEGTVQPVGRKDGFSGLEKPLDILDLLK